ncbi:hypothetical protein SARC_05003 [Sphaeroforma arctica JP610]|uniref:Uncharacterized protein n=1 Tax=Sphaeroforma arctica JP610 TaxID=667725 RepID=A0A0L0G1M1_9EUKA|nr:hypothetical protein SARC_05003 [Sphaeroforma arctica JP610]KNC82716.1 hypothetical protein SARC_05003 [Sphaeroforma arctica JP610]|eukprot:XP_014156618.1 hypothetical protein SARC_05003 [Sphaeroforma arctica JP610]
MASQTEDMSSKLAGQTNSETSTSKENDTQLTQENNISSSSNSNSSSYQNTSTNKSFSKQQKRERKQSIVNLQAKTYLVQPRVNPGGAEYMSRSHVQHMPPSAAMQPMQHYIYENTGKRTRILMVAHVHGRLNYLNNLIQTTKATAVINAGNFGFYDDESYNRMRVGDLESRLQSSMANSLSSAECARALSMQNSNQLRVYLRQRNFLSELPSYINGDLTFRVPVYTVWGVDEDIRVIEKIRSKEYRIRNLFILDESRVFTVPQSDIQLVGLGGNLVYHWLFDNGQGQEKVSGDVGKIWVTLLQLASLVDMADKSRDPTMLRVLVTHVGAGREPLIALLAHRIKADYSVSGHFHSRYCVSMNTWAVNEYEVFLKRLQQTKQEVLACWKSIEAHAEQCCQPQELVNIRSALELIEEVPSEEEYLSLWRVSLPDMDSGHAFLGVGMGDKYTLDTYTEGRDHAARIKYSHNNESKRKDQAKSRTAR